MVLSRRAKSNIFTIFPLFLFYVYGYFYCSMSMENINKVHTEARKRHWILCD